MNDTSTSMLIYLHFNWKSLYFPNALLSQNCPLLPKVQSRFGGSFTIYINLWHLLVHCLCIVPQCWAICNAFLDSCFMEKRASCWLVWPSTYRGDLSLYVQTEMQTTYKKLPKDMVICSIWPQFIFDNYFQFVLMKNTEILCGSKVGSLT